MSDQFAQIAAALQDIIADEFSAEGFTARLDHLHESLGRQRVDIGISPEDDFMAANNRNVQNTIVKVQFYDQWKQEISPDTVVDPTRITGFAERFKAAIRDSDGRTDPATGECWFFELERISYPKDPTGNKTRFEAYLKGWGNNAALVETV